MATRRDTGECRVVVVGCGTQAANHLACFAKLRQSHKVRIAGLVDPCEANGERCRGALAGLKFDTREVFVARSLEEAAEHVDLGTVVVDIVTPNRLHYSTAAEAVKHGASKLIVEKPLAHTLVEAKRFMKLDGQVCVLENYLFSEVTRTVREIVETEGLTPLFVKTEFSKDRRAHSASGRGMTAGYVPHVFTVEMPHQVAIVSSLLGDAGEVTDAWHHDMILSDGRIAGHGEGALTLMHSRRVPSYNFSCLQGFRHLASAYRSVKVYCEDRIKVCGYYSTTVDLDGAVHVYKANRLLRQVALKDDSLKNGLQESLECLSAKREPVCNLSFGIDVLRVIEEGRRVAAASL